MRTPYKYNTNTQSLRAGFYREGGNIIVLIKTIDCGRLRQNLVDGYSCMTRKLYLISSGADDLFLSFSLALDPC